MRISLMGEQMNKIYTNREALCNTAASLTMCVRAAIRIASVDRADTQVVIVCTP